MPRWRKAILLAIATPFLALAVWVGTPEDCTPRDRPQPQSSIEQVYSKMEDWKSAMHGCSPSPPIQKIKADGLQLIHLLCRDTKSEGLERAIDDIKAMKDIPPDLTPGAPGTESQQLLESKIRSVFGEQISKTTHLVKNGNAFREATAKEQNEAIHVLSKTQVEFYKKFGDPPNFAVQPQSEFLEWYGKAKLFEKVMNIIESLCAQYTEQ